MKNKRFIVAILLLLIGGIYVYNDDSLPPRTAHRVGRAISGLSIPESAVARSFEDRWGEFVGDGYTKIVFDLSQQDSNDLERECVHAGFKPYTQETIKNLPPINHPVTVGKSLYKVVRQDKRMPDMDYAIVVFDQQKRQLVLFSVVA